MTIFHWFLGLPTVAVIAKRDFDHTSVRSDASCYISKKLLHDGGAKGTLANFLPKKSKKSKKK